MVICSIGLKLGLLKDIETFQTLQTLQIQHVTITWMRYHTHYHTRYRKFFLSLTWITYNATHYHNFNMLPHVLLYIFSQFIMVWRLFATGYHASPSIFLKNINIHFNINLMVTRGNLLQIAPEPC